MRYLNTVYLTGAIPFLLSFVLLNCGEALADYVDRGGGREYFGRVLSIDQNGIGLQVNCDAEVIRIPWQSPTTVDFTKGCRGDPACNNCGMGPCIDPKTGDLFSDARTSYLVKFSNGDSAEGTAIRFEGQYIRILDYRTRQWLTGLAPNIATISLGTHCATPYPRY